MAVKLGSEDPGDLVESADINITPFIDVILVLMIVFMVAAPLATVSVPVELPTSAVPPQPRPEKPIFVTVTSDLAITVGEDVVPRTGLGGALDGATKGNKDERIYLRADKGVPYGEVMQVMNLLRASGYLKVGLIGLAGLEDTSDKVRP